MAVPSSLAKPLLKPLVSIRSVEPSGLSADVTALAASALSSPRRSVCRGSRREPGAARGLTNCPVATRTRLGSPGWLWPGAVPAEPTAMTHNTRDKRPARGKDMRPPYFLAVARQPRRAVRPFGDGSTTAERRDARPLRERRLHSVTRDAGLAGSHFSHDFRS